MAESSIEQSLRSTPNLKHIRPLNEPEGYICLVDLLSLALPQATLVGCRRAHHHPCYCTRPLARQRFIYTNFQKRLRSLRPNKIYPLDRIFILIPIPIRRNFLLFFGRECFNIARRKLKRRKEGKMFRKIGKRR